MVNIGMWYLSFNSFVNISSSFAQSKFLYDDVTAGYLASFIHILAAVFCPTIGIIIDFIGKRPLMVFIAGGFNALGFLYFAFLPEKVDSNIAAIFGYLTIGLGYSFFAAASWPMISYVVERQTVGTATGIGFCFQAIGILVGSLIVGAISVASKNEKGEVQYFYVCIFLAVCAMIAMLSSVYIFIYDCAHGRVLWSSDPCTSQKLLAEKEKSENKE